MEFLCGALASCGAVIISNPFDVLKTRMQLQGELKSMGRYTIIYRNVFHALYSVAKVDGIFALQKGLLPAMSYQVVMNGTRFGLYQRIIDSGFISYSNGSVSTVGCIASGAGVGIVGGFLIKTQLQAQAHRTIAVGHQHKHTGVLIAFKSIFEKNGIVGLWRGCSTAVLRVGVGSASQLFVYSKSKDWLDHHQIYSRTSWQSTLVGALTSGLVIATLMSPFDVVSTRIYNQALDANGKGVLYRGVFDCLLKSARTEGIRGLYKGWSAIYLRVGPHSFFNLIFWDSLVTMYKKVSYS
ncbi:UNVERIFIED_CONTAM: hypothetical protein GTU68_019093 [Idotea baltica]|nr:hypothetical protein [Idotea baltica]